MNQSMKENTKHRVRLSKVLLNLILSAAIIFGSMPCKPFVMEVKADDQPAQKSITGLGTGEITHPMPTSGSSDPWNGDYVYFGKYNGEAMKYRVLSILDSNTVGNNYLLLDCDNVLTNTRFDGDSNIWAGWKGDNFIESDIHKWLVGEFYNKAGVFSTAEKYAIIGDNTSYEGHWTVSNYPDGTYENNALNAEDPVFLLDARSVINDNQGYLSNTAESASRIKKDLDGHPAKWWLRSKSTETKDGKPCVFSVETDGSLSKNSVNDANVGVSPALTVNRARVLFSSKVEDETGFVYKLTLASTALGSPVCMPCTRDGNKVTISYSVSHDPDYTPTQLSVVVTKNYKWDSSSGWIKKNEDENAKLLQYAKLDTGDSFKAVGIGTFVLDPEIEGEWGEDYNVYILAEKVNGKDETDYASTPVEIKQLEVSVEVNKYTYDGYEHWPILSAINADSIGIEKEYLYGETPDSCSSDYPGIRNVSDSTKTIYYIVNVQNYLSAKGSTTVTINKRPLTVGVSDRSIPYGSPLPEDFELVCDGLAYNDNSSVLKGTEKLKFESDYVQGKDAGSYPVRIKGELTADNYDVNLTDGVLEVVKATHPDVNVSGNAVYGTEGILELKEGIEAGGSLGEVSVSADDYQILDGAPKADGTRLRFKFKDNPENVGKKAKVTVSVNGAKNYLDYTINAGLEAISCDHSNKKLVEGTTIPGTCTQEGYEGDYRCPDCGAVIPGKNTPIDPENHDFVAVEVVKPATIITKGETKYRCSRCHTEKIVADIPCVEGGGEKDYDDLRKDVEGLSGNNALKIEEKKDENGNTIEETVTIGGEEISKTVTDPESGKETIVSKVWIAGLEKTYTYTGSAIKPSIRVYDGTRKLIENTDYKLSCKNNKKVGTDAQIIIKFKGSYSSSESKTAGFEIVKAELGKDIIALDTATADEKKVKKTLPSLVWAETGKSVSSKYFDFEYGEVSGEECTVTIRPKTKYSGTYDKETTAKVRIVSNQNLLISKAKITFNPKSYAYTGKEITPSYKVTIGNTTLVKDTDFTETVQNGINPGTATLLIEAKPGNSKGYAGSKTATFKITGTRAIKDNADITFDVTKEVPFAKGGAKAAVVVKDGDKVLKEGVDYTLSYSKNKSVTNGETAVVKIKGKGNYKGNVTEKFAIVKQQLSAVSENVIIADQFTTKDNLKEPSVSITDLDGKKLSVSKDYEIEKIDTDDPANTSESGTVRVTIKAREDGSYEGRVVKTFRYMKAEADIRKAKIKQKIADQSYTGHPVKLSNEDLTGVLSIGNTDLVPGKDFIIDRSSYRNNNKKGTAKVDLIGTGAMAGRKTVTFKIINRTVDYSGSIR